MWSRGAVLFIFRPFVCANIDEALFGSHCDARYVISIVLSAVLMVVETGSATAYFYRSNWFDIVTIFTLTAFTYLIAHSLTAVHAANILHCTVL